MIDQLDIDRLHQALGHGDFPVQTRGCGKTTAAAVCTLQHADFDVPKVAYLLPQMRWLMHTKELFEQVAEAMGYTVRWESKTTMVVDEKMRVEFIAKATGEHKVMALGRDVPLIEDRDWSEDGW